MSTNLNDSHELADRILALRTEAGVAGDPAMVDLCDRALAAPVRIDWNWRNTPADQYAALLACQIAIADAEALAAEEVEL